MRIDAMLCDYAQVNGGKLYVTGASINLLGTPPEPPFMINVWLAATVRVPFDEVNKVHTMRIAVKDTDGKVVPIVALPPGVEVPEEDRGVILAGFDLTGMVHLQPGDDALMPLAMPLAAPMPNLGPFAVIIEVDDVEQARLPFRLQLPAPAPGPAPAGKGPADIPVL